MQQHNSNKAGAAKPKAEKKIIYIGKKVNRDNKPMVRRFRPSIAERQFIRRNMNYYSVENLSVDREEVWSDVNFSLNDPSTNIFRITFDPTTGPAWFKKMCTMYEKVQVHQVQIVYVPGDPATASGNYCLSYNTNYSQKSDTRTIDLLAAQKNARTSHISRASIVTIPGGAMPHFRTNAACTGNTEEAYHFNVEIMRNGNFAMHGILRVRYSVTFRNPQL